MIFGALWKDLGHPLPKGGGGGSLITWKMPKNQDLWWMDLCGPVGVWESGMEDL